MRRLLHAPLAGLLLFVAAGCTPQPTATTVLPTTEPDVPQARNPASGRAKIVAFTARWCSACKNTRSSIMRLQSENPDVEICELDIDEMGSESLWKSCQGDVVPSWYLLVDGKVTAELKGFRSEAAVASFFDASLRQSFPDRVSATQSTRPGSKSSEPPVRLTSNTVSELKRVVREERISSPWFLRLRVEAGGCQGYMSKLDIDPVASADVDHIFITDGVSVAVSYRHVEFFRGATVDYVNQPGKRGFEVRMQFCDSDVAERLKQRLAKSDAAVAGERAEWIARFRRMTSEDPDNELAQYRLGQLLLDDGQYAEAIKPFELAIALAPKLDKGRYLLAICLLKDNRRERAISVLRNNPGVDTKSDGPQSDLQSALDELGIPRDQR